MGTYYTIKVVVDAGEHFAMADSVDRLLDDFNRLMSNYIEDSEISRLNNAPAQQWIPISDDMLIVLEAALETSRKSDGAFDITVAPLVNLWGFGPEGRPQRIPAEEEIRAGRTLVGFQHLQLRRRPPAVKKGIENLTCDLAAIAKGYGVDVMAGLFERQGFSRYMVEIGGEIRTRGLNQKNQPWRIGISTPDDSRFGIQKVISLRDISVATSGDYRNYFEQNGVRFSHTIDPRSGRPISHKLVSVTVIHPSCMMADAWATTISVLGPDDGFELAQELEMPVFMIVKETNGFAEKMTSQFKPFI